MARDPLTALRAENERLSLRLEEAEAALEAIRKGEVESLVVEGPEGPRIFSLEGAAHSYRVLVEAMNEGAATLSEDGTILYCNARFAEILGSPLERVMGSTLSRWIPRFQQSNLAGLVREAGRGESRGELSLGRQDESELPVHLSIRSFYDDGKRLLCVVATDLSEQRRNEKVLAEGRLARSVLEQAADAIVVCDENGRITRASRAAEQLCGCSPLRADFDAAYPIVLSSPLLAGSLTSTALRGAVTRAEPATLTRVDGTEAHLLVSATPLSAKDGHVIGCVVTMVDVTEHRRAEEELRAAEERLRTLGDNLPEGAVYRYAHDASGRTRFLYISGGIEALTGVAPAEILRNAQALHDTIHPEDRGRMFQAEERSRETLAPFEIELRQRHRKTGEVRWALLRSVPRRLADGSTVWDGFHFDITARKQAEDALRQVDRNRTHFLAMLSHELRNPLMPLRNSLFILERSPAGSEQAQRAQAIIQRQIDGMARLIDDLLDATRVARGKMQIRREPLDLRELVRQAVEDHRPGFDEAGVALEVELTEDPLPASADRTRLSQIVGNLLQNAIKFTPRGGHVQVTLERDARTRTASLSVRDDGRGIQQDVLARLFEPFSQEELPLEPGRGGLGLGLALVKGIAELHGGSVSAASPGPGKGAEFVVRLPVEAAGAADAAAAVPAGRPVVQPRRVLIIEDNVDSADSLREVLKLQGHTVELARDGLAGVVTARQFLPDVVLCDIGLPGMDGYEVARAFRADESLKHVLLVALSGYAMPDDLQQAFAAGFRDHLAKPASPEALERILAGGNSPTVSRS